MFWYLAVITKEHSYSAVKFLNELIAIFHQNCMKVIIISAFHNRKLLVEVITMLVTCSTKSDWEEVNIRM